MSCGQAQLRSMDAALSIDDIKTHGEEDVPCSFSIFWTAYVPVALIAVSLLWERLTHLLGRSHAHSRIACSDRRLIRRS